MQISSLYKRTTSPWSRLPIAYRGAVVIAIPAICLIITLIAWFWSRQAESVHKKHIDQIDALIAQSDEVLTTLVDAETGVRGYNLSLDSTFLEPYNRAVANLPAELYRLEELSQNNPQQMQRIYKLRQLIGQRLERLEERIKITQQQKQAAIQSPQTINSLSEGKAIMDSIRVLLADFKAQEQSQLKIQQQHYERVDNITSAIQWISAFASVIAYLGAVYLFNMLDSELKEREEQLLESSNIVEAITSNMVDGVVTLAEDGTIETINQAASEIFGYQPSEMAGKNWTLLLIDPASEASQREEQIQFWQDRLKHQDRLWQATGYSKNGTVIPIEIAIAKMDLNSSYIAIIRDLSERYEAEQQLKARADELAYVNTVLAKTNLALRRQNQELDKFAYVASHDLKAPLRAIASLSEWIEEDLQGKLADESQRMMKLLRGRVYRLEALINGLLEYSRIGRIQTTIEIVDVAQLLQEIVAFLDPPPGFKIEIEPRMPVFKTKRRLLREVFLGLIDNAIKHSDRDYGKIKITGCDRGNFYEFAVSDDGPGIAPEFHEKIFAIFQTLQARDVVENTGIGLSLIKKILEIEGGNIWLESEVGKGATFYFTWPARSAI